MRLLLSIIGKFVFKFYILKKQVFVKYALFIFVRAPLHLQYNYHISLLKLMCWFYNPHLQDWQMTVAWLNTCSWNGSFLLLIAIVWWSWTGFNENLECHHIWKVSLNECLLKRCYFGPAIFRAAMHWFIYI